MPAALSYARDSATGKTVWIESSSFSSHAYDFKGALTCLDAFCCGAPVFAKRGTKRIFHFSHYPEDEVAKGRCKKGRHGLSNGESEEHLKSKHFLAVRNAHCKYVRNKCDVCGTLDYFADTADLLPAVEHRLVIGGKTVVIDVALLEKITKQLVFAVEVKKSHWIGSEKRALLAENCKGVLEVTTDTVLREIARSNPGKVDFHAIHPVDASSVTCSACTKRKNRRVYSQTWQEYEIIRPMAHWDAYVLSVVKWYEERDSDLILIEFDEKRVSEEKNPLDMAKPVLSIIPKQASDEHVNAKKHRDFQRQGISNAQYRIDNAVQRYRKKDYVKGLSFKCEDCQAWKPKVNLEGKAAYTSLYLEKEFRKIKGPGLKNMDYRFAYENWTANICSECYMQCPECDGGNMLSRLAVYGCCLQCNINRE